ncbi:hypothetical protein QTO34_005475 [Cnephaeus nilssonii]|uniref:Uncharacterized protein n=1 Tax=Cnephaeus nilssonii TaxID=3371016 RepID=A0AA40LJZ0_CNENI|nr:hypothetical protein QTO34_005475 [Eptesicus nilssonii]
MRAIGYEDMGPGRSQQNTPLTFIVPLEMCKPGKSWKPQGKAGKEKFALGVGARAGGRCYSKCGRGPLSAGHLPGALGSRLTPQQHHGGRQVPAQQRAFAGTVLAGSPGRAAVLEGRRRGSQVPALHFPGRLRVDRGGQQQVAKGVRVQQSARAAPGGGGGVGPGDGLRRGQGPRQQARVGTVQGGGHYGEGEGVMQVGSRGLVVALEALPAPEEAAVVEHVLGGGVQAPVVALARVAGVPGILTKQSLSERLWRMLFCQAGNLRR